MKNPEEIGKLAFTSRIKFLSRINLCKLNCMTKEGSKDMMNEPNSPTTKRSANHV